MGIIDWVIMNDNAKDWTNNFEVSEALRIFIKRLLIS